MKKKQEAETGLQLERISAKYYVIRHVNSGLKVWSSGKVIAGKTAHEIKKSAVEALAQIAEMADWNMSKEQAINLDNTHPSVIKALIDLQVTRDF